MSKVLSTLTSPTVLLYIFLILTQIATGMYLASGLEPPAFFTFIYAFGFLWIIGWWLHRDSSRTGVPMAFDMGLFLYVAWPLVLPYYLIKSRGAKGLLVISGFVAVYIGATLTGLILYILLAPDDWPTAVYG